MEMFFCCFFFALRKLDITDVSHGFKVKIAIDIIRESRAINEKVLMFSRSIPTLGRS